jgi:nucleotide-binding universal stress UspA family protein
VSCSRETIKIMNPYLVALDNSSRAPVVLAAAIALARRTGAKLILFRAVGLTGDLPVEAYAMSPDSIIEVLRERARRELDDAARAIPAEIEFETRVDIGTAWPAICQVAKSIDAAMIIIGSHGFVGIDLLLGTTAARVVNHADRSVFVVRHPELLAPT